MFHTILPAIIVTLGLIGGCLRLKVILLIAILANAVFLLKVPDWSPELAGQILLGTFLGFGIGLLLSPTQNKKVKEVTELVDND